MPCNPLTSLTACLGPAAGGQATAPGATSSWTAICESFAKAAQQLLSSFAKSFVAIPPTDLSLAGVRSVYGLSLEIAAVVAAVLLMAQVIRTVLVHDGSAIAQGLIGIGKAALAFALTLGAAATALRASDELTSWIVTRIFGSPQALSGRLAQLASFTPSVSPSLLFILALLGILLTLALWAQLLVRNVAVTVLVAISPIAAAGQVAHATQHWWRKLVQATIQLIVLKPVVALIFAIGLTLPGTSGAVEKLLSGMLVLLLAGIAWPAMARATAVLEVYVSGGVLGRLRGGDRVSSGTPGGVNPAELSRVAEGRTMAAVQELRTRSAAMGPAAGQPGLGLRRAGTGAAAAQALGAMSHGAGAAGPGPDASSRTALSGGTAREPVPGGASLGPVPGSAAPPVPGGGVSGPLPGEVVRAATDADGAPILAGLEPGHPAGPGSWRNR